MTEYADKSNEELVSAFIVGTCRQLAKSSHLLSDHMQDVMACWGSGLKVYLIYSIINICCELLHKLSEWLNKGQCPNYFIPEANLFHEPSHLTIIDGTKRRLNGFRDSGILCHWFEENYIMLYIRSHFEVTGVTEALPHFMDCMLHLFKVWKASESESLDLLLFSTFICSHRKRRTVIKNGFSSGLRVIFKFGYQFRCLLLMLNSGLPTKQNVSCFTYYDIVLHILHIVYGISCGEMLWVSNLSVEVINAISMNEKTLWSGYHNFPTALTFSESVRCSRFQFQRAQELMQNLTGSNYCRSEFQLVALLSKEFLQKSIEYEALESNGIAPAALSYLAALHFATSEYHEAMLFCTAVLEDKNYTSREETEALDAGCLLFIDDIARIVGLYVLHKKITDNSLRYIGRRLYLDLRLSPKVFAQYVSVSSHQKTSKHFNFSHDLPDSAYHMDDYLKSIILKAQCVVSAAFSAVKRIIYRRTDPMTEIKSTFGNSPVKETVIEILMEYASENMTAFYNAISKDFGIQCNTADCYRALYLYKCQKYDEVLHLCERILHEPDLPRNLKEFSFANVLLIPPLDSFFDRDIQSLLGFHTLFYYLSPLNGDIGKTQINAESAFEHFFARLVYYMKCELLCLLKYHYIRCHYFLEAHFLARYLKVLCCIDCDRPYIEAIAEFAAQKTNHPFEHIIRSFLLRKLRLV